MTIKRQKHSVRWIVWACGISNKNPLRQTIWTIILRRTTKTTTANSKRKVSRSIWQKFNKIINFNFRFNQYKLEKKII